jgi:hypothetical protein
LLAGTIFLEMWKRKNAELAYEWDVEQYEQNEPDRPSFQGTRPKKVICFLNKLTTATKEGT